MTESARDPVDASEASAPARDPVRRWTVVVAAVLSFCWSCRSPATGRRRSRRSARWRGWCCRSPRGCQASCCGSRSATTRSSRPGAAVAEIDPTPFRLAVEAAEAELAQVGQSIGASTADVAAAQARVAEARGDPDQQPRPGGAHARAGRARRDAGGGGRRGDRGRRARDEATVAAAEADLRSAERGARAGGADNPQLRAAQAALETAQFNLSQTRIVAPTRGRVTNFSLGPGETVTAGQPVLTMIDLRGAWIDRVLP